MEENIQFMLVTKDGIKIPCNVKCANIFEAAKEAYESIQCGDLRIAAEDVIQIVDIPG